MNSHRGLLTTGSLLFNTCSLLITHFMHCMAYAAPALTLLFAMLYTIHNDYQTVYVVVAALLFIIANTLFIYAASEQMLKQNAGSVDIMRALVWRQRHNDFFVFISLGIIILVVLSIYFIDAIDYFGDLIDTMIKDQQAIQSGGGTGSYTENAYSVFIFGSRLISAGLLLLLLFIWSYLCRTGIRIPAHVEHYYLRIEEARNLTQQHKICILAVSLLFISAINAFSDIVLVRYAEQAQQDRLLTITVWTIGYFFMVISHVAIWTHTYVMLVKNTGYHMNRVI